MRRGWGCLLKRKKDGFTRKLAKDYIHSTIPSCPVVLWFFIVVVNTMTKGKWKKKKVYLAYMLQVVTEISQCSNIKIQNKSETTRNAPNWFVLPELLSYQFNCSTPTCIWLSSFMVGWVLLYQINIKILPKTIWWRQFLDCYSPLPGVNSFCQGGKNSPAYTCLWWPSFFYWKYFL